MTAQADLLLAEARSWIGTPYVHQATSKGAGTDCLGLVRGVWRNVIGPEPEDVPPYTSDWSEASRQERLWQAALRHMTPKEPAEAEPGDVLLFRMRQAGVAKHLGILSASGKRPKLIHAYTGHGVIESPLSAPWRRRIVACFSIPERT